MRYKITTCCIIAVLLFTIPLYGIYHKIAEVDLYYFTSCIAMKDDVVYVGTSEYTNDPLFVVDVENPNSPEIIGQYNGFADTRELCIYDTVIYIACDRSRLNVGNITDPYNITITYCCSGITFNSIKTKNEYAFTGTNLGLVVLDITLPEDPTIIDTLQMPEIEYLTLNQNSAYALTDEGLYVVDISNPQTPFIQGIYVKDFFEPAAIAYHNDYIYIAAWSHVYVFDVSEPQNLDLVCDRSHLGFPTDLYVKDSILYACGSLYGFGAYDISNPLEIKLVNNYVTPRQAVASCMDDDYVYVADWGYGLEIIARDDTPNPYLIQHYFSDDLIINCFKNKSPYLYFSEYYRGIGIYDRNDPTGTPVFPVDSIYGGGLAFNGSYLYMNYYWWQGGAHYGVLVYDCENPLQPELLADIPYDIAAIKILNSCLYSDDVSRLRVYDVSDPLSMNCLGYVSVDGGITDYGVTDSLICICNYDSNPPSHQGLYIFSNFDNGYPQQLSFTELYPEMYELEVFEDIALAAYYNLSWYGSDTGFYVIDISDPYNPQILDHIIVHDNDSKISFSGFGSIHFAKNNNTLVVVDNSNNRIITYDCTDFANLQVKDEFWWNFKITGLTFNGNELMTCNFGNGITVMDLTDFLDIDEPQEPIIENKLLIFPNPISTSTNIRFNIKEASRIKITLYNIKGQMIEEISDDFLIPGEHTIEWNGNSVLNKGYSSGIYLMGFEKDGVVIDVQKVILLE